MVPTDHRVTVVEMKKRYVKSGKVLNKKPQKRKREGIRDISLLCKNLTYQIKTNSSYTIEYAVEKLIEANLKMNELSLSKITKRKHPLWFKTSELLKELITKGKQNFG